MRTAAAALALALLLSGAPALGWQNTEVLECTIVSVDTRTRLIQYHQGDSLRPTTLFVPSHVRGDLSGIEEGDFAAIEFELDTGRRQLVSVVTD
jgi:hypothetical protein